MQLQPRYDDVPAVDVATEPSSIRVPFLRQRRRLATTVSSLTGDQLATPSRCEGWTVANVLTHLIDVDNFWGFSLASGLGGEPTRVLASFDPEATPKELVSRHGDIGAQELRDGYVAAATAVCNAVEALDDDAWTRTAEAPPGHVTVSTMLHHALWDCWTHERDLALPLGLEPDVVDDEVVACLTYAAGISPSFGVWADDSRSGTLGVVAENPSVELTIDIGRTVTVSHGTAPDDAPRLTGDAVDLVEGLTQRAPLDHDLPDDQRWMVDGLREVFQPATP